VESVDAVFFKKPTQKPTRNRAHNRAPQMLQNATFLLKSARNCKKWHKSAPSEKPRFQLKNNARKTPLSTRSANHQPKTHLQQHHPIPDDGRQIVKTPTRTPTICAKPN